MNYDTKKGHRARSEPRERYTQICTPSSNPASDFDVQDTFLSKKLTSIKCNSSLPSNRSPRSPGLLQSFPGPPGHIYIYQRLHGPQGALFYKKIIKTMKITILKKSGFGVVLVQFWIRIRILHEKLYILFGSNHFSLIFENLTFSKIKRFVIF